jgi:Na,K-Atpase Interacting protein
VLYTFLFNVLSFFIIFQLFIIERQTIDFLGYMWAPILVNFFHIIFVIFGFFGAYTFRIKYLVTVSIKKKSILYHSLLFKYEIWGEIKHIICEQPRWQGRIKIFIKKTLKKFNTLERKHGPKPALDHCPGSAVLVQTG